MLLLCLSAFGYFAYHAIKGRHGLEARARLQASSVALSLELQRLEVVHRILRDEVHRLAPESLDEDRLDEVARRQLGFLHPDDRVLILPHR